MPFFPVENLIGLGFRSQYGTQIQCRPHEPRPANLTYFAFRSVARASALDSRGPDNEFSFDFVLKLPQTLVNVTAPVVSNIASPHPVSTISDNTAEGLEAMQFELGNLAEDHLESLSTKEMRSLLKRSVSAITSSPVKSGTSRKKVKAGPATLFGVTTPSTAPSTTGASTTPKMDRVFAHSASGVTSTYTGPFNFLEDGNQAVFTSIFGVKPTPLWMDSVKKGLPMENAEGLKTKLLPFVSLCHLFIFCSIVYRRYVGTSDYDKTQIITDVEEALSDIKLER